MTRNMTCARPSRAIRVAVADDHLFVRSGLRRFISSFPEYDFAGGAASAEEALELVQGTDIDVLVFDANMPGSSGLEILPQLSAIAPRMKVLVVSASPGTAFSPLELRAEAFAYLEKPFNPQTLDESIRSAAAALARAASDEGFRTRSDGSLDGGTGEW
jgi:two-component system invasion response regulator UvrY